MSKIKRDVKQLPVPAKVDRGVEIVTQCTGNANIPGLTTEVSAFSSANTTLETAMREVTAAQEVLANKVIVQNNASAAWDQAAETLFLGIELKTGGDAAKITTCGVSAYDPGKGVPVGLPAKPVNLAASAGDLPGSVDLQWDVVRGVRVYAVQRTTTPTEEASWQAAGTATKSSYTVLGLATGTQYFFRVAAIGAAGQGPFSDPAQQLAP